MYTATFHPATHSLVVTAGFDRVLRLWRREGGSYSMLQVGHVQCSVFMLWWHSRSWQDTQATSTVPCLTLKGISCSPETIMEWSRSGSHRKGSTRWRNDVTPRLDCRKLVNIQGISAAFESSTDSFATFKHRTWSQKREYKVKRMFVENLKKIILNISVASYLTWNFFE